MKRFIKTALLVAVTATIFTGCDMVETHHIENYNGQAIKVAEGVYFKKVYIQGVEALLQCDKDGNITHNQNISTQYPQGETQVAASVLTPTAMSTTEIVESTKDAKFNFNCNDINDCYNKILVVKSALGK